MLQINPPIIQSTTQTALTVVDSGTPAAFCPELTQSEVTAEPPSLQATGRPALSLELKPPR